MLGATVNISFWEQFSAAPLNHFRFNEIRVLNIFIPS
jgi:hypothetical protein